MLPGSLTQIDPLNVRTTVSLPDSNHSAVALEASAGLATIRMPAYVQVWRRYAHAAIFVCTCLRGQQVCKRWKISDLSM